MSDTWKLRNRESGEIVHTFDVADMDDRTRAKFFNGLVLKVDFSLYWLDKGLDE